MTEALHSDWITRVYRSANRFSLTFLHLGASNEPARRALVGTAETIDVEDYIAQGRPSASGRIIIVDRLERLAQTTHSRQFGPLREQVFKDVEEGVRIVLLSRSPRLAFPPVVGSSVLEDSSFVRGPSIERGIDSCPTCEQDGKGQDTVLRGCLEELGPEICASLDRVIYEYSLQGPEALRLFNDRELEALQGSGLIKQVGANWEWNLPRHLAPLKDALAEVLSNVTEAQQGLQVVTAGLWKIERLVRRAIRRQAIEAWGKSWRQQCISGGTAERVLKRASEAAYHGASSVKHLRDPLEWLTLGELLELKEQRQIGRLGIPTALWNNFTSDIMPVRNRVAHMRMLRPNDSADVLKWAGHLEKKLGN